MTASTYPSYRPVAVDLFAGAGGMSLGFEQAGFDVRAAVEVDPVHCATHKFNFPECAVIPRSVVGLTAEEIRCEAGIGDGRVDCVFGGPPCQGFSLIGLRALDDPRNKLVLEFVRIVAALDARSFVFENVRGLTSGNHRSFLVEIIEAFGAAGYDVVSPWRVLDAASYGVPQHRERLFLMGVKRGERSPTYPEAMVRPADRPAMGSNLPVGPTCLDALHDLPDADGFAALLTSDQVPVNLFSPASDYAREARCWSDEAWHYGYRRTWNPKVLTASRRTEHSEISQRRFAETCPGNVEPISRFYKLSPSGLCNTLRAGTDGARGAFTSPRPIHYEHPRCVTVREMARLHGYPDWFRIHSTKWHGARQIGNSVPPPLARAVAGQVLSALGHTPCHPRRVLALGDESLLSLTVGEAADRLGVDSPPSRRDRKSGARKRKQSETETARLAALEASGAK
jgi:DNA (cytosine-5)-methyltransferase 1